MIQGAPTDPVAPRASIRTVIGVAWLALAVLGSLVAWLVPGPHSTALLFSGFSAVATVHAGRIARTIWGSGRAA